MSEDQIKKMLEDLDIKYRNTYDDTLSLTSTNAVQNQAVTKKFKELDDKNTRTDNELTNIKSSVNTALSNSKSYTDSKISETKIQIDSELNKKANQTNIDETVDELNKSINLKVDKVFGKGLSTNDFNDNYKSKLDNLDSSLNSTLTSAKSHTNSEITKVDNKIKSEISRAQASETNLSNRIDGLKEDLTNALNEAKEYTDSEVKNNTNKINTLTGTGEGSVVKTVKDEIAKVVDGAPEQFNTLKEISEYLNSHEDVASGLVESITKLETEKLSVSDIDSSLSTESENPVMNKVVTEELNKKLEGEVVGITSPTEGTVGGSYDDTELRNAITDLQTKDTETDEKLTELSEEINGKVFFQTDVLYKIQQFKIFEKLEKGKAYTFLSSVPCGIEYYTESGKYVHLFDAQTEIEFICPSDYDETKPETLKREGTENGTMLIKDSGLADKQQELIEDVGALAEQTSQIADSLLKRKDLVANEDYQVLQGQVNINGILNPNDVNYWRSSPIEVKRGDVVYLTNKYKGSGMAIGRTDADGNYYHLLVSHNDTKDYRVEITFDGYIAIGYIKSQLPTQFYIETSSIAREKGKAENYADFNLAKEESAEIDYKALEVQHETHFTNLCIQARFERGKMVAELATLTDDDILAQGSCGYTESNGQITDGTIQWKIYKGGLLHISGHGKMYDFVKGTEAAKSEEEVHQKVRGLGAEFWYYGFVNENVNGIVPPFPQSNQKYETDEVMNYSNKRYVPFGEEINPLNGKPYGYSAPWYIYRVHVDDSYTSYDLYKQKNPNGITYNRILIEEDASKGGITYIGNWAFYRVSADTLILPASVTKIGCWGVRYSPVLKALVMGDNITTIEDHGVSRMEAMEAVKVSNKLVSLGYEGMSADAQLKMVEFPDTTTSLGSFCFNGCGSLQIANFGSCRTIPRNFATLSSLVKAYIPITTETIGANAFYKTDINRLIIPSNVLLIETDAFRNVEIKALVIESQEVLNKFFIEKDEMTMQIQQGASVSRCNYILIPTDLTMSYALEKMFVYIGADDSYKYYKRDTDKLT